MNTNILAYLNQTVQKFPNNIAIDDNEIAQLKLLCNQIFGEENFIAQFIRKNKAGAGHDSGQIAIEFDYMLCFALNKTEVRFQQEVLDVENDAKYKLEDNHLYIYVIYKN